jgi:hypothetical protein
MDVGDGDEDHTLGAVSHLRIHQGNDCFTSLRSDDDTNDRHDTEIGPKNSYYQNNIGIDLSLKSINPLMDIRFCFSCARASAKGHQKSNKTDDSSAATWQEMVLLYFLVFNVTY